MWMHGAFTVADASGEWSYVIRDELDAVIQSGAGCLNFSCNPLHMELKACIEGTSAATQLGITNLVLETYAQQVVCVLRIEGDTSRE
jgi:ribonuclease HI